MCFGVNARFGVTDYSSANTNDHHRGAHRYLVSNTVLSADVILNVPKLKTHMKTGMTGALKNFVGIVGSKDFLPHFRTGSPRAGGDEYPDKNWLSHAASPVRELLQTRAPLWMWRLARAGAQASFLAADPWRRLARQRYAMAHDPRPGGYRAQLRRRRRSAAPAADHPDAGGCHRGGRRLRPVEAAPQTVRSAGLG